LRWCIAFERLDLHERPRLAEMASPCAAGRRAPVRVRPRRADPRSAGGGRATRAVGGCALPEPWAVDPTARVDGVGRLWALVPVPSVRGPEPMTEPTSRTTSSRPDLSAAPRRSPRPRWSTTVPLRGSRRDPVAFWARAGRRELVTGATTSTPCSSGAPFARGSRRHAQRVLTTASTATSGGQGRPGPPSIGRRPGDTPPPSPLGDLLDEVCRFANALKGPGSAARRPRSHLHAMIPSCRWPCWPAAASEWRTRSSFAGFSPIRSSIGSTTPRQGHHHRRRRLPARAPVTAQAERPTRPLSSTPTVEHVGGGPVARTAMSTGSRAATTGTRPARRGRRRLPAGAAWRPRTWLYLLYTSARRPSPGHHAHHGRLSDPGGPSPTHGVDLHPDDDVYWCAATSGGSRGTATSSTAPSPRAPRSSTRAPPTRRKGPRLWDIAEPLRRHPLYTAPTAIRMFMKWGDEEPAKTTCRSCACWVGRRPINPRRGCGTTPTSEAGVVPSSDTWWQTETGAQMISPLPG